MYKQNSLKVRIKRLEAYQGKSTYETALVMYPKDGRYIFNMEDQTRRVNNSRLTYQDLEDAINQDGPKLEKILDEAHIKTIIIDDLTEL